MVDHMSLLVGLVLQLFKEYIMCWRGWLINDGSDSWWPHVMFGYVFLLDGDGKWLFVGSFLM